MFGFDGVLVLECYRAHVGLKLEGGVVLILKDLILVVKVSDGAGALKGSIFITCFSNGVTLHYLVAHHLEKFWQFLIVGCVDRK